jgi:hypothetical protein
MTGQLVRMRKAKGSNARFWFQNFKIVHLQKQEGHESTIYRWILLRRLRRPEVIQTGSGSSPMADLGVRGVELLGPAITALAFKLII